MFETETEKAMAIQFANQVMALQNEKTSTGLLLCQLIVAQYEICVHQHTHISSVTLKSQIVRYIFIRTNLHEDRWKNVSSITLFCVWERNKPATVVALINI